MKFNIEDFTAEHNLRCFGVYMISHKNTEIKYIGSTYQKYGFKQRWLQHLNNLSNNKGNKVLLNIYNKYGIEGFEFKIIEIISDINIIRDRELYWINYYDSYNNGANCSLDTKQSFNKIKTGPLTEKHKYNLHLANKSRKKVYLYDFEGNLLLQFNSSVECDRFFKLKKGRTSSIISKKSNTKRIIKKYFPSYNKINKEDWNITFGYNEESKIKNSLKHKNKITSDNVKNKIRLSNSKSIKIELLTFDNIYIKSFNSLNECDDYLKISRGSTSKFLRGKCKSLKRKFIVKII